ncbi:unnamed protein product [Miscanthus lutarioriparius]|uniref:Uncharacterized protein n=1 Tax=Miscanthus lutarioriparius TaxID=422564 RepID=A0A811RFI1_9POAL|nr:unnamed protein product [Miscanthus lutarioriparius]
MSSSRSLDGVPPYFVKNRWDGVPRPQRKKLWPTDFSGGLDIRLETWNDPTPRESEWTVHDLHDACVEALSHDYSYFPFSSIKLSEEQRQEHDRKSSVIALEVYTKQNNMQPTDLEFVEVKQRNIIGDFGKGYLHLNFLVKGLDEMRKMFISASLWERMTSIHQKRMTKVVVKGVNFGQKILYIPIVVAS